MIYDVLVGVEVLDGHGDAGSVDRLVGEDRELLVDVVDIARVFLEVLQNEQLGLLAVAAVVVKELDDYGLCLVGRGT